MSASFHRLPPIGSFSGCSSGLPQYHLYINLLNKDVSLGSYLLIYRLDFSQIANSLQKTPVLPDFGASAPSTVLGIRQPLKTQSFAYMLWSNQGMR